MQIEEMTPEQVTSRVAELLHKAQNGGIATYERAELESLQDVRTKTLAAKQARDRALREYQKLVRPEVEQLPNARQNFAAAANAVTKQGLNNVGDYDSNFLAVQQRLEKELRQPMTIENIVRVLSDGSVQGLAPNPNVDELLQEKQQEERAKLINEIVEDWSPNSIDSEIRRRQLERPDVTLDFLQKTVNDIRDRRRLRQMSPDQIRAENQAKRRAAKAEPKEKPIHVAAQIQALNNEYPPMPTDTLIDGREVILDHKYIQRCNGDQLKHLIRLWGETQVVNRLRQIS
jgi:hypothetical protein